MKHERPAYLVVLIGALWLLTAGCSQNRVANSAWLASLPKPWVLSAEQVTQLLPEFRKHYPDFHQRLKAVALWRVGTPYELYRLGEEVEPDPDPIFRLDVSDCTAHILTSLCLAQSSSWSEARHNMIAIHYKPDAAGNMTPSYRSRWHYTTDRITANPSTVDITPSLLPPEELATVDITLNRKADGSEFLDLDWSRELTARYIPSAKISAELLARLPAVCGVTFVKKSYFKLGLVVAHEGMIIDRQDLIHAGLAAGETERTDFLKYYFTEQGPLFDGIMVFAFVPLAEQAG